MTDQEQEFAQQLLDRYHKGVATEEESKSVDAWFNAYAKQTTKSTLAESEEDLDEVAREIWGKLPVNRRSQGIKKLWLNISAAAAVAAIVIGIGFWNYDATNHENTLVKTSPVISTGEYGATLRLSNGKEIKLGKLAKGQLIKEAGVVITKTADGQLVYQSVNSAQDGSHVNTLSTSAGETFRVNLPDGSSVWLNAMSSLAYSTDLATTVQRKVTLTGEGYFEVAKNPEHPFIVKTPKQEIKVLGTAFNVSSYGNDDLETTTLIHGSIAMHTANDKTILKPGEQGVVRSGKINTSTANIYSATGWKNNEFVFASQDIRSIMKLIARWYDVNVEYRGDVSSDKISGSISRFSDIHSALDIIEATGTVKIRVEGKKVIVSNLLK